AGAPPADAQLVCQELVTSSLMGHDSHGVLRIPEYVDQAVRRVIVPGAAITVDQRSSTTAIVDGNRNFGSVTGHRAMEVGMRLAREHKVACVITHHCHHVGRLGAYPQRAAANDLIALASCSSPVQGHFVPPWGGLLGRLSTNPIAYGVPTGGNPILGDLATSAAPEGKV